MTNSLNAPLARLIAGQICLHACMAGMRMAAPLLALQQGYSAAAVGVLLALFALTQVFLALPAGRFADRHGLKRPVRWAVGVSALGAALSAAWFWQTHGLNALADDRSDDDDDADFVSITRSINGGTAGLSERRRYWALARQTLGLH